MKIFQENGKDSKKMEKIPRKWKIFQENGKHCKRQKTCDEIWWRSVPVSELYSPPPPPLRNQWESSHFFYMVSNQKTTCQSKLLSGVLSELAGAGRQMTPCSPCHKTFTFHSKWRKSLSPCYPLVGLFLLLLLLVGHDPHSQSDWSLGCHFRSRHSPLRATRRTRPEKCFEKQVLQKNVNLVVDEVVVLNPPDVQRLDSGPGKVSVLQKQVWRVFFTWM